MQEALTDIQEVSQRDGTTPFGLQHRRPHCMSAVQQQSLSAAQLQALAQVRLRVVVQ